MLDMLRRLLRGPGDPDPAEVKADARVQAVYGRAWSQRRNEAERAAYRARNLALARRVSR